MISTPKNTHWTKLSLVDACYKIGAACTSYYTDHHPSSSVTSEGDWRRSPSIESVRSRRCRRRVLRCVRRMCRSRPCRCHGCYYVGSFAAAPRRFIVVLLSWSTQDFPSVIPACLFQISSDVNLSRRRRKKYISLASKKCTSCGSASSTVVVEVAVEVTVVVAPILRSTKVSCGSICVRLTA